MDNFFFDVERKNTNLDPFFKEEFIEMTFDLEAKSMHILKGIGYYWMNENTSAK